METKVKLQAEITAKDKTKGAFNDVNKGLSNLRTSFTKLATVGTVAFAGIVAASVKAAADFEKSMGDIQTLYGDSTKEVATMEEEIKNLLKTTPTTAEDLGASAYAIVSAGISDASDAMNVLKESNKLGVAGLGTTAEATDVVTSAINSFNIEAKDSNKVADIFFKTVQAGKTNISELAQGFGQVAPLAEASGVQFEDLMSTTGAMTTSGLKASIAYSQIRGVLSNMLKPTKEMKDAMDDVGITSNNLEDIMSEKGLTGTIRMLSDSVDGNRGELAKMFGSVEGLNAVMMLLGETGDNQIEIMNNMTDSNNTLNDAYDKQIDKTTEQYKILKNQLNVEMMELGNKILPYLVDAMELLPFWLETIYDWWDSWTTALSKVITFIDNVISAISRAIKAFNDFKTAQKNANIGVFEKVGAGIGKIMGFQQGGIVPGPIGAPVPAIVHGGETVIPANQSPMTININNPVVREEQDIDRITQSIIDVLSRRRELAGFGAIGTTR